MARAGHRLGRMAGIAVGLGRSTATATETYLQGHVTTRSRPTIPVSFFFLQPVAGLTSRVPVQDSRAGAPLEVHKSNFENVARGVSPETIPSHIVTVTLAERI